VVAVSLPQNPKTPNTRFIVDMREKEIYQHT
jgi:hypothetical protein